MKSYRRLAFLMLAVGGTFLCLSQWRSAAHAEDLGRGPTDDTMDVDEMLDGATASSKVNGDSVPDDLKLDDSSPSRTTVKETEVDDLDKLLDGDPAPAAATTAQAPKSGPDPVTADMDSLENELDKAIEGGAAPEAESSAAPSRVTPKVTSAKNLPAAPAAKEISGGDPSVPNAIKNLEFKNEPGVVRIVVSADHKLAFKKLPGSVARQQVYVFENTTVPERLQRAYDTSEFPGAVALFTLLQIPNSQPTTSKLIVQLRDDQAPTIVPSDRGLTIDFPVGQTPELEIVNNRPDDLLNNENIYATNQKYRGEVIKRLEIKDADIQDVLRLIAKHSGYSIVVGDDVQGRVGTLSLDNTPWDQAFTLLLQSKRLGYIKDGKILRVASLQSLRTEREEAAAMDAARRRVDPLKTVLLPVSFAQVGDLSQRIRPFMGDRGSIDADIRSNTLIVRDIASNVERMQRLVSSLDTPPATVSVTAKLVEASENFTKRIGISRLGFSTLLGGINMSQALNLTGGGSSVTNVTIPQAANLDAQLQLAQISKQGKILASPTISVLANQAGTVRQSISFFVPAGDPTGGTGGSQQIIGAPQARQVTASLMLNVVPVVSGDGTIFMNVRLNNETPVIQGINTTIDQREVTTQVLIDNGDTAVIAGVFSNTINVSDEGVPFLMHIPILGNFFKNKLETDVRGEILVFLTARVTNAEQSLKRSL